jgi:hypothetical protein
MANNREYSDGRENTNQGVTLEWEILRAGCLAWMALADPTEAGARQA